MEIKSFDELIARMQQRAVKKTVAVVSAADQHTLEAVIKAKNSGVVHPVLIGDQERIEDILGNLDEGKLGLPLSTKPMIEKPQKKQ